jgi:hypothetical protein
MRAPEHSTLFRVDVIRFPKLIARAITHFPPYYHVR